MGEIETQVAVLVNDVNHLKNQVVFRDQMQEALGAVNREIMRLANIIERLAEQNEKQADNNAETSKLVNGILQANHDTAIAAAKAETEKANHFRFWNLVKSYGIPFLTLLGGAAGAYGLFKMFIIFLATAPK